MRDEETEAGTPSDGSMADGTPADGGGADDGSTDAGEPDGSTPACAVSCSTDLIASGYARGIHPGTWDPVEILAATASPDGSLHALLARGPDHLGWVGRQWVLVSRRPGQTVFAADNEQRTWPALGAGDLEGGGYGLDAALLRAVGPSIEATVLFTVRESAGFLPIEVHVARIAWTPEGSLLAAGDLGRILTLPDPSISGATVFEIPSGDVIAAIEHDGVIEGVRIMAGGRIEHLFLGDSGATLAGAHPVDGTAVDDTRWYFVGGGRAWNGARTPFASAVVDGEPAWHDRLPGTDADSPPRVARAGDGAVAVHWHQNPDDIDDAVVTATRLLDSAVGPSWTIRTPRLPMPLDAHVGGNGAVGFAAWSVRAPDVLDDTLVYLALLAPSAACGATEAHLAARLPGAAATPSVRGALVGADVVVFGEPVGRSGHPELTALRVQCEVE